DIILSVGYRKKIPVGQAKYEINLHGGLLPRYRGGAVLNWAIINGEKEVGVTAHIMLDKFDAGDIVSQKSVPIGMQDDVLDVYKKTLELYPKICIEVIEDIEKGTLKRIPQQEAFATYTKQRKPEDGIIDWNKTSLEQYNWIRALTHPYPGAFTFLQGQKITIWKSIINNKRYDNCKNGEIVEIYKDGAIVKTKDASLLLLDIEPKISLNIGDILK
ncbi:MAG: methionyl-tRNA formyltransferase, partial [Nanoarchaeota archaeon]|nr:methionyl-tRNA formyltransferase [Nanoarchaeota archaeon]